VRLLATGPAATPGVRGGNDPSRARRGGPPIVTRPCAPNRTAPAARRPTAVHDHGGRV